jgi:hypothetical protein
MGNGMEIELLRPRYIPAAGRAGEGWDPWIEVAVWVRARVEAWGWREDSWLHWAMPAARDADLDGLRRFDYGRRAAVAGEPPRMRALAPSLDSGAARALVARLVGGWEPLIHRMEPLGLTSRLEEGLEAFRRRCSALLVAAMREGRLKGPAAELVGLASEVRSRKLGADEIKVLRARVGVGWYPDGEAPLAEGGELLVAGPARGGR